MQLDRASVPAWWRALRVQAATLRGTDSLTAELSGKRLELLKEVLARLSRVGVLWNQLNPGAIGSWETTRAAARTLRLELLSLAVRGPDDFFGHG